MLLAVAFTVAALVGGVVALLLARQAGYRGYWAKRGVRPATYPEVKWFDPLGNTLAGCSRVTLGKANWISMARK